MGPADGPLATSAEIENGDLLVHSCCTEHKHYKRAQTTAKLSKMITNTFVQRMLANGARAYAIVTHTCKNAQCVEETDRHAHMQECSACTY